MRTIIEDKQELRRWAKGLGRCREEASSILVHKLRSSCEYKKSKNIMLFYPVKNEVNLLALLEDSEKNFFLPRICGRSLCCCPFTMGEELSISSFHTKEPVSTPVDKNIIDLVIVPALCCDKNKFRLGYGGGFYDRFLKDFKGIKLVCMPKELIVNTIYPESHDVPVDVIIST